MDFDQVDSASPQTLLTEGVKAVLEHAQFKVTAITDGQNQMLPVPADFQAEAKGARFVVKCLTDPGSLEVEGFRNLVEFCQSHGGKVMIISDGEFSDQMKQAAAELSVQLTGRAAYRNALENLPPEVQNKFVSETPEPEPEIDPAPKNSFDEPSPTAAPGHLPPLKPAHSLPPVSAPQKQKSSGVIIGKIAAMVAMAAVLAFSGVEIFSKVKTNLVTMRANQERMAAPVPVPVNRRVQNAMLEIRRQAGFADPVFDQNGVMEILAATGGSMPSEKDLKEIQGMINPALRIGSSTLLQADTPEALVARVKAWEPLSSPGDAAKFGNVAAKDPAGPVWAWLYRGTQISQKQQLDEALVKGGIFSMKCRHCDTDSTYRLTAHAKNLVSPICKNCGLVAHIFGPDTEGNLRRACDFLTGFEIPEAEVQKHRPPNCTPRDDVMAHWKAILDRCDYEYDSSSGRDIWKLPEQTWGEREGDCEDTTILLVDALISSGYEARVAFGLWQGSGHAWAVVKVEDRQYILETTMFHTGAVGMRRIIKVGNDYIAHGAFDRDSIYLRRNAAHMSTLNYFSDAYWMPLKVNDANSG